MFDFAIKCKTTTKKKIMKQDKIIKLYNDESIEKEIKQYVKIVNGKKSKYKSLDDMKRQLFSELCSSAFPDEKLNLLKEVAKIRVLYINDEMSIGAPILNALNLTLLTVYVTINGSDNIWYLYVILISILFFIHFRKSDQLERIGFYNMLLELIENAEQLRGHTFMDTLLDNKLPAKSKMR